LVFTLGLVALGFASGAASLVVQRVQTQRQAEINAHELTAGDPQRGKAAFVRHGCGGCHAIRNVQPAAGQVGPPLDGVASRAFLAGTLSNDPQHMIAWVRHPQALQPGVGMPETGLSETEARDVAAYLYTLR
jgi:cytochrome c2